jgi:hypothetical protein
MKVKVKATEQEFQDGIVTEILICANHCTVSFRKFKNSLKHLEFPVLSCSNLGRTFLKYVLISVKSHLLKSRIFSFSFSVMDLRQSLKKFLLNT